MEFKIDTKNTFSVITPVIDKVNAKLADEIIDKCRNIRQSGSFNLILDLEHVKELETDAVSNFVALHEESYSMDHSLVLTELSPKVMAAFKQDESDLLLNIAPKMKEAIDIVSMEMLERDLFSEE